MFAGLIDECRARFAEFGVRRAVFGGRKRDVRRALRDEGLAADYHGNYALLTEAGRVVWGSFVQANAGLYAPGDHDLPANSVFGVEDYFDARPHHLLRICESVYALKNTSPGDVVLAKVAAVISDEQNNIANWRLPWRLTDGHHVYLSSTMVHRSRLPGGVLAAPILPLVVAPGVSDVSMVLPLSCWSPTLIQAWPTLHEMTTDAAELATRKVPDAQLAEDERDARDRPHRALSAEDLVSGASQASVTLTANCAAVVRDLARQHKLRGRWWLKLGGSDGAWTLDMATSCDATEYLCVESRGVLILIPRRKRGEFQGLVVDFKETTIGAGFVFYSSSSSSL